MTSLKSFFFLIFLYYFRALPIEIFWRLWAVFAEMKKPYSIPKILLAGVFILIAHLIAFVIIFIPVLVFLNTILESYLKKLFGLIFLQIKPRSEARNQLYSFLLSPILTKEPLSFLGKNCFFSLAVFGAILVAIGGIETLNSFSAHRNPDFFDLIFSEFGSQIFFGGLFLINFSFFYLYFLYAPQSLKKWRWREKATRRLPHFLKFFVFSTALTHPYFFRHPRKITFKP